MGSTKKVGLATSVAALAMATCSIATLGMAHFASAAEEVPEPVPAEQGWYIVGNGAGSLKTCSWSDYEEAFKLEVAEEGDGKTGIYYIENVTLYQGDAFKILYANGEWNWPSDSGWTADVMAQYSNLVDNDLGYFVDGGLGNIQATQAGAGVYDFELEVTDTEITLSYARTASVTPIAKEEMYVVGTLKNYPTCNWPGAIDVATACPKLTLNADKKWTVKLNLEVGDEFKVYNLVNNGYFPSGVSNNCIITEAGEYEIEYGVEAPSFIVTNVATGEIVYQ